MMIKKCFFPATGRSLERVWQVNARRLDTRWIATGRRMQNNGTLNGRQTSTESYRLKQKPEIRRYLRPLDLNFEAIDLWKTFCKYYSNKIRLSVNVSHTLQNRNINTGRLSFFETKKTLPAGIFLLFFDYFCIVITLSGKSEIRHIKNHSNTLCIIKK